MPPADRREDGPTWDPEGRARFLAGVRLFHDIPPAILAQIAARLHVRAYSRGELVFRAGEQAQAMSLLGAGRIKLIRETEDGREAIVRLITPGEIFGAAGGWGAASYPASAMAQGDAVVLRLPADEMMALLRSQPDFALAVIREQGLRLAEAAARIEDLRVERVDRRLARTILRLSEKFGTVVPRGIELALTRQDLAELAGTTLSTASRTVSDWSRRHIVAGGRQRITLLDAEALAVIAGSDPPAVPNAEPTVRSGQQRAAIGAATNNGPAAGP
ncbi:MAG: Crp/Fnr family transcriptional regulator [Chloroflexi bacterium]|nr:Crp/Fnr family transcriptional regulator [Chloroflexota bacterium]